MISSNLVLHIAMEVTRTTLELEITRASKSAESGTMVCMATVMEFTLTEDITEITQPEDITEITLPEDITEITLSEFTVTLTVTQVMLTVTEKMITLTKFLATKVEDTLLTVLMTDVQWHTMAVNMPSLIWDMVQGMVPIMVTVDPVDTVDTDTVMRTQDTMAR